jgi:DNA-binding response OmpR family regulator/anti-sigma regulatory factor (Ser/Thr protein kinase)
MQVAEEWISTTTMTFEASNSPCVLAVDDDALMRLVLEDNLSEAGFEVLLAEDGEIAWQLLQENSERIECLVLDRMMPNLDGMGLLLRAKADERFKHLPVIFETAAGEPEDMTEGIAAGAYYYLVKPFNSDLLITLVRSAVEAFRNIRGRESAAAEQETAYRSLREAAFEIRTIDEVHALAPLLARLFPDPGRVNLGIIELLINAVEHGNLGINYGEKTRLVLDDNWRAEVERRLAMSEYADKHVHVHFLRDPHAVRLSIRDQGEGFDWRKYLSISADRALDPHGRGIAMSRMISFDNIEYVGNGNQVDATISLA